MQAMTTECLILEAKKIGSGFSTTIACGNVEGFVWFNAWGLHVVQTSNASHIRARIGPGRNFRSVECAIEGYKSASMKSIIRAANAEYAAQGGAS